MKRRPERGFFWRFGLPLLLGALILPFLLYGLGTSIRVKMRDASADAAYAPLIGKEIRLREDVWVLGIAWNGNPPVEYYMLVGGPGFGGRDVISHGRLRRGSVVRIARVMAGSHWPFRSRVEYVVEPVRGDGFPEGKMQIDGTAGEDGGPPGLRDPAFEWAD